MLWGEKGTTRVRVRLSGYVKNGKLIRIYRGIYAKDKNYDRLELAARIYTPSYISFETVLRQAGVIFQHYDTIFAAGPWSKTMTIDKTTITFRKLKDTVLFNSSGIIGGKNYSVASPERAFLDTIYLFPEYYFDNLEPINWKKCFELAKLYGNRRLVKRLVEYQKKYAE